MIIGIIIKRKGKNKNKSELICLYISHTKRLVNVSLAFVGLQIIAQTQKNWVISPISPIQ